MKRRSLYVNIYNRMDIASIIIGINFRFVFNLYSKFDLISFISNLSIVSKVPQFIS